MKHSNFWYYGWYIVLFSSIISLLGSGMRMGAGPFFLPMLHDYGYSRSTLATVMSIGILFYGIGMPLAGYLVKRYQTKFVLIIGAFLMLIASIWTTLAKDIYQLSIAYGVLLSLGLAFLSPTSFTPMISRWFIQRRGQALFFLSTGGMAGIALMTILFNYTISYFGWKPTLIGFAICFFGVTLWVAFFIIREEVPELADRSSFNNSSTSTVTNHADKSMTKPRYETVFQAIGTRPFWLICLGVFSCGYSMNLLGSHGVTMLIDNGFDNNTSALGVSLIGLVAIVGTLILGKLADRLSQKHLLFIIYFVRGLGFFALVLVTSRWQLFSISFIGGLVWAGSMALSSVILANTYGAKLVGILFGWAFLVHQIGGMISSFVAGWAYETYHSHFIAFGSAGLLLILASLISLMLPNNRVT